MYSNFYFRAVCRVLYGFNVNFTVSDTERGMNGQFIWPLIPVSCPQLKILPVLKLPLHKLQATLPFEIQVMAATAVWTNGFYSMLEALFMKIEQE